MLSVNSPSAGGRKLGTIASFRKAARGVPNGGGAETREPRHARLSRRSAAVPHERIVLIRNSLRSNDRSSGAGSFTLTRVGSSVGSPGGRLPEKIGKYEILEQIGVGGFGAVYRGRDPYIKRTVAVKTCQLNDEEIKSRFFREAELAGNLHHRHITTIYDFGVENGIPYIVQEFLSGEDLDKIIKRGDDMTVPRKIEILMAITEGLGYAHQQHIIHRDIKPANIRILADGSVKIMDFGIAKSLQTESSLTQTGITLGTSAYLAPEQIRGDPLDQRTDIFALGVVAYELLTYRKPFRGEHLSTVLYKILNDTPEPIEAVAPDIPASLSATVTRAMEKDIGQRYPSMEALRLDLHAIYRQLSGSSARFTTAPRLSQSVRQTGSDIDPDATIATPSKGMMRTDHITPPSGALARVPAPQDRTPTAATHRRQAGLELVNFRDPSQAAADGKAASAPPTRPGRSLLPAAIAIVFVAAVVGGALFLSRAKKENPRPVAAPIPAPTAPIVFPQPDRGSRTGRRESGTGRRRPRAAASRGRREETGAAAPAQTRATLQDPIQLDPAGDALCGWPAHRPLDSRKGRGARPKARTRSVSRPRDSPPTRRN